MPSAQHQGLNLHNLLARRVGVGSSATLAWGKGQPRMPSGLWPPLPCWSGYRYGAAREPHGTHLTVAWELKSAVALASAF